MIRTPLELVTAINNAVVGEVLLLEPGNYGHFSLTNRDLNGITLTSADTNNRAVFTSLNITGCHNFNIEDLYFKYIFTGGFSSKKDFTIDSCSNFTIYDCIFEGALAINNLYGHGIGLSIRKCFDWIVDSNQFFNWWKAAVFPTNKRFVVSNNNCHGNNNDAFNFAGAVLDGVIENNYLHNFNSAPNQGHRDMIQFWPVLGEEPATNIIIRNNILNAGTGTTTQSIFMRNGVVDQNQGNFAQYSYKNILIEKNKIYNNNKHGITVGESDSLMVRDNVLLFNPDVADSKWVIPPKITIASSSKNVAIEGNITVAKIATQPGWVVSGNKTVPQPTTPSDLGLDFLPNTSPTLDPTPTPDPTPTHADLEFRVKALEDWANSFGMND